MVVLTFWLSALAPMVSQAVAATRAPGQSWADICSTASAESGDAGTSSEHAALQHLFQHCPMCSLHAQDLTLPPSAIEAPLRQDLGQAAPERFLSAAVTLHAWRPSQARAPPR